MRPSDSMYRIVDGVRYSVAKATLLADDAWWDGHNYERQGRNRFLYRTPKGRYFVVTLTCWQEEHDNLRPMMMEDALQLYEDELLEHYVDHEEAFPDVKIEDA